MREKEERRLRAIDGGRCDGSEPGLCFTPDDDLVSKKRVVPVVKGEGDPYL